MKTWLSLFLFFTAACATKSTSMDKDQVKATIKTILPQVHNCYASTAKENPEIKGKMTTAFDVDDKGTVTKCGIASSDLKSPAVENCVCQRISETSFPAAPKGKKASINYPFTFTSSLASKQQLPASPATETSSAQAPAQK